MNQNPVDRSLFNVRLENSPSGEILGVGEHLASIREVYARLLLSMWETAVYNIGIASGFNDIINTPSKINWYRADSVFELRFLPEYSSRRLVWRDFAIEWYKQPNRNIYISRRISVDEIHQFIRELNETFTREP